jgi:4-hydroxybenzoyl-CoA thioesterase
MPGFIADPVHVHRVRVGFGDCDPAGIVYFPRFFHFFHEAMESWFDDVLGLAYADMIYVRKLGFPAVHTEADFRSPVAMGREIAVEQRVVQLGRSSIRFAYTVRLVGEPADDVRLIGATVSVVMDLDPQRPTFRRAVPLPDDLRDRIAPLVAPVA